MIETTVLSVEPCGNLVAVELEVKRSAILADAGPAGRNTHSQHSRSTRTTVFVEAPYEKHKLDPHIAAIEADMAATQAAHFSKAQPVVQERTFVNGAQERSFYRAEACPAPVTQALQAAFPQVNLDALALISSPAYHDILEQNVISTFLWEDDVPGLVVDGRPLITRSRKFCLESGKSYDRLYTFADGTERYGFLPDSCRVLAKSVNTNVQAGLHLPEFADIYFAGDAEQVQHALGLPPRVGAQSTYYGVTVLDGRVVRAKQYCYDQPSIFFDWDGAVVRAASNHGVVLPRLK